MRGALLSFLVIFMISGLPRAQQPLTEPDPEDIEQVTRIIDSLPWFIKNGEITEYPTYCSFQEHRFQYFIGRANLALPTKALHVKGKTRVLYIRLYALSLKAARFYHQKEYGPANRIWKAVLEIATEHGFHYEELHLARKALNNTSFLSGNYALAMEISSEGLNSAERLPDLSIMAHFSNVIGYIHMKQKNFPEASRYFTDYYELSRQIKDTVQEAHALYNLGDLFIAKGSFDSALNFLDRSIQLYRLANKNPEKRFDIHEREGYIYNKIAEAYCGKKDHQSALSYIRTSLVSAYAPSGVNAYDKAEYFIRTGYIYNHLHRPDSAIKYAHRGLAIARHIIHREHMMYAYEQLSFAFAKTNHFDSAWFYQGMFQRLKDTITSESSQRDILLRDTSLRIEREKAKQQALLDKQRIWRNILIGLILFMMIISYLLYTRYRLRQKNRLQAELNKQQSEILRTTIDVQDRERKRIAEDLHDSLGSILSAAKLKLSAVDGLPDQPGRNENELLYDALTLLDEAITEMKSIAYNIMPATLSRLGLIAALQNLFNRISNRSSLKINFLTHGFEQRLDQHMEVSIYRIILESINNVVKHAGAKQVTVQLIRHPGYINIAIEDDGKGFRKTADLNGNGLANIESRVKNLGGSLDIDSSEGSGTTIFVDIPHPSAL